MSRFTISPNSPNSTTSPEIWVSSTKSPIHKVFLQEHTHRITQWLTNLYRIRKELPKIKSSQIWDQVAMDPGCMGTSDTIVKEMMSSTMLNRTQAATSSTAWVQSRKMEPKCTNQIFKTTLKSIQTTTIHRPPSRINPTCSLKNKVNYFTIIFSLSLNDPSKLTECFHSCTVKR